MYARILTTLLLVLVAATGCSNKKAKVTGNQKINQWLTTQQPDSAYLTYRVQSPDRIRIVAPNIRELDGQIQTVRPDGNISLNLLGDVQVAGKTPQEIGRALRQVAGQFYDRKMLDITVQIEEFNSQVVYIFGQVREPGVKPFTGRETILAMLAMAQLNDSAWPQKVVIVRPHDDPNVKQKVTVDLKEMFQSGQTSQNYMLEPGDVVYVPPSPLAQLNANFEKLMIPIRPVMSVMSLTYGGI